MKNIQKGILFILSIIFYAIAILIIGFRPMLVVNKSFFYFDSSCYYCLSIIFSIISFNILMKFNNINNKFVKFLLLFFMIYFALVFGANNVFDFILNRLIAYYENNEKIYTPEYEQLWQILINDLSRNFLYIFGLFYSAFATWLNFLILKVLKRIKQKN